MAMREDFDFLTSPGDVWLPAIGPIPITSFATTKLGGVGQGGPELLNRLLPKLRKSRVRGGAKHRESRLPVSNSAAQG
jgi:hypothetical protein